MVVLATFSGHAEAEAKTLNCLGTLPAGPLGPLASEGKSLIPAAEGTFLSEPKHQVLSFEIEALKTVITNRSY